MIRPGHVTMLVVSADVAIAQVRKHPGVVAGSAGWVLEDGVGLLRAIERCRFVADTMARHELGLVAGCDCVSAFRLRAARQRIAEQLRTPLQRRSLPHDERGWSPK